MNVRFRHRNKNYGKRHIEFIGHSLDCDVCIVDELACCSDHSIDNIDNIIFNINEAIADMGRELLHNELYGYRIKECKDINAYTQLKTQKEVLEKHLHAVIKNASTCLTCKQLEVIIENVRKFLGHDCRVFMRNDITIDSSDKAVWDKANPYCISREKWEQLAYHTCEIMGIDIKITSLNELCNITFDTIMTPQLCDIVEEFKIEKRNCEAGISVVVQEQQCELNHKLLVTSTSCDMDLGLYLELLKCNLTAKIIQEVYSCDMQLKLSETQQNCAMLITTSGTEINLCSLNSDLETELINNSNC